MFFGLIKLRLSLFFFLLSKFLTKFSINDLLCPSSTKMPVRRFLSSLMYFSDNVVWDRYRKPLKTLLVILGSIHESSLIWMFVIASFRFTLNSHFLLVVLLAMIMSGKFIEYLRSSNPTVYFIAGSCLFSISKNSSACDLF